MESTIELQPQLSCTLFFHLILRNSRNSLFTWQVCKVNFDEVYKICDFGEAYKKFIKEDKFKLNMILK